MAKKFTINTLFAPAVIRSAPRTIIDSSRAAAPHVLVAENCSRAAVQAAINSATTGSTVMVPAGTCTWDAAVTITDKTITLQGAGSGSGGTKIIHSGGYHRLIEIEASVPAGKMDVSGFWFYGPGTHWNGTAMAIAGPVGGGLRVHHNVFDNNDLLAINVNTNTYGVIDHNTFRGASTSAGIMFHGNGESDWSSPLILGAAEFFFVEDNIFDWECWQIGGCLCVDMENGGRFVFRNNTVTGGFVNTHDKARSTLVSANAYEVYNNTFDDGVMERWKAIDICAGTGVIWGNIITGDWIVPIGAMDYKSFQPGNNVLLCDGNDPADQNVPGEAGWRCQYQIGTQGEGASAVSYPLYLWSNTYNGDPTDMVCTAGCVVNGRPHLLDGRDFINNGTTPKPGYTPYTYPHPRTVL